ncbi:FAD-dependent oxidoreductase [Mycolicibacterium sp. F2034L]|uniref:FAD-dependent oxidoreductase n=1 Tax=Mycolicibacterium sp. F2034L TaxID=2926422 RepID=UPI001FF6ED42|nr:FAD-dependent oxidoreductase [Mycolicibacterium sp. F2034L]MCK0172620.1 FAD-dependent oxidoreductase [Mycolicibacterium sp. F2034L]
MAGNQTDGRHPLIVGAGPAGLTASLELLGSGVPSTVFECTAHTGGLARTARSNRWLADPGGHRFMTTNEDVLDIWRELVPPDDWLTVDRSSAMFVDGHYVKYPLEAADLLRKLGPRKAVQGVGSYALGKIHAAGRRRREESFQTWGLRTFGEFWYRTFFDSYTRKTWRVDPTHITSDWARQRIQPIQWAKPAAQRGQPFSFPAHGPGQVWQSMADRLTTAGNEIHFDSPVTGIHRSGTKWELELADGSRHRGDAVFSTMPLRTLIHRLHPTPPDPVVDAAWQLAYRDVVTVAVPVGPESDFPHQWVYIPQNDVHVGRVQNYGQWSRHLIPEGWKGTCLGLEYYVQESERDEFDDAHYLRIAESDLAKLGVTTRRMADAFVVRSNFAYPIYDDRRADAVSTISRWLTTEHPDLYSIGRNGMHRYYNQDHAMISAVLSVQNYLGKDVDHWTSNIAD